MCRVLDGRKVAADLLAKEVHSSVPPWKDQLDAENEKSCKNAVEDLVNVPDEEGNEFRADDLAIWIDPIGLYIVKNICKQNIVKNNRDLPIFHCHNLLLLLQMLQIITFEEKTVKKFVVMLYSHGGWRL